VTDGGGETLPARTKKEEKKEEPTTGGEKER
jgi:hypothetical protein